MAVSKATGIVLCLLLTATPLLLLIGVQVEQPTPVWQLPAHDLLEYAWRQPKRVVSLLTGQQPLSVGKVVQDTGTVVSALPDATVHAAGAAVLLMKSASVEGLRSFLQGVEWGYLKCADAVKYAGDQLGIQRSHFPDYTTLKLKTGKAASQVVKLSKDAWDWIGPGGRLHPEEFLERYRGHILIECLLGVTICYLFFQRSFKWSSRSPKPLTEEEIDELCDEWQPEPLNETLPTSSLVYEPPVISSSTGRYVTANGKTALNMVAFNFLGAAGDPKILEACQATVSKYGVGACGPRGFYGTIDVHLELEERLAKFMGRQEGIIYSYDLSTIPSVLPAFANAKDLIVIDEVADFAIQNGANLSRARVVTYKHNDMEDLERVLELEVNKHKALKKPLNRRFIVVEGISKALGDIAPLEALCRLKHKFKFRLVVDESLAFGVLGSRGRGACEHFGLGQDDVEIICASMGNALASVGGFCVGAREIVDHQRLSGLGYCFSAALPPYLATAAIGSINILEERGKDLLAKVQQNARSLRSGLAALEGLETVGSQEDMLSPVVHVRLAESDSKTEDQARSVLQKTVDEAFEKHSVLFTVTKTSALDKARCPPSIRLVVTAEHSTDDIDKAVNALDKAFKSVDDPSND